jgi:hypothetical protein
MTPQKETEVERLARLVDKKLESLEAAEKPPTTSELNAVRRLIEWVDRERALERSRKLTTY